MDVRLILKKATRGRTIFRLKGLQSILGRARGCVVRIPSADVSREHCRIMVEESTVTVQDLGSLNGTLLNGVVIDGVQEVKPGDFLRVGPALFEIQFDASILGQGSDDEFVVLEDDEVVPEGADFILEPADDSSLEEPILLVDSDENLPVLDPVRKSSADQSWRDIPEVEVVEEDVSEVLAQLDESTSAPANQAAKKRKKKK